MVSLLATQGAEVAHALLRAAATLVSLPLAAGNPEASPRVATRHAGVRAPRRAPGVYDSLHRGLWRGAHATSDPGHQRLSCERFPPGIVWRSPQTSPQAIGNTAVLKSVVGQDFILRPIFNGPARRRFHQGLWRQRRSRQGSPPLSLSLGPV